MINDSFGHHAGDQPLIAVAQRLDGGLCDSDTLARLRGDEFVVLCDAFEHAAQVLTVAERIIAQMCEPFQITMGGRPLPTSAGTSPSQRAGPRMPQRAVSLTGT